MDVTISAYALLSLAPLLIGVAIAIKVTSPGPVLVRQTRYGYRNRRFLIYKFRTVDTHYADDADACENTPDNSRVANLRRFLRRTSLDEFPKLLNVLKGDMSLVGPRPHLPGMLAGDMRYEHVVPYYFQRHSVRPGITGLAQVRGYRGSTQDVNAAISSIDLDLEYIEHWSPWLDAKIILHALRRRFRSDGIV